MESELPKGWENVQLSEIVDVLENGNRPKGGVKSILSGVPSIGAEYLSSDGCFNVNKVRYIPQDFFDSMKRGKIQKEDILIVKDGATTGKVSFVDDNFKFKKAAVNEHVFILRVNNKRCLQKFMFYYLYSKKGNQKLMANFKGTAQGGINTQFINNFEMILPPIETQKQIVVKLDAFFKEYNILKEEKTKASKNYDKIGLVAFTKLLEYKEHAQVNISEIITEMKYGSSSKAHSHEEGTPILRMNNIDSSGNLSFEDLKYIKLGSAEEAKYLLSDGDILINRTNSKELVGKCAVFRSKEKFVYASYLIRIRVNTTKILPEYLVFYLAVGQGREQINNKIRGVTNQWNINAEEIKTISVALPSLKDQREILNQFNSITRNLILIEEQEKITDMLELLPYSVLTKAFAGALI